MTDKQKTDAIAAGNFIIITILFVVEADSIVLRDVATHCTRVLIAVIAVFYLIRWFINRKN